MCRLCFAGACVGARARARACTFGIIPIFVHAKHVWKMWVCERYAGAAVGDDVDADADAADSLIIEIFCK